MSFNSGSTRIGYKDDFSTTGYLFGDETAEDAEWNANFYS